MNFDFTEEQLMLRDQANACLTKISPLSKVRNVLESDGCYDKNIWQEAINMGWTGAIIPEEYGGHGFGFLDLCVVSEELGRSLAPIPFSSSVYLATIAILNSGTEEQKRDLLPKLASGELIGTVAVSEGSGSSHFGSVECSVSNSVLNGSKIPVPDAQAADFAIVLANDNSSGESLFIVDLKEQHVEITPVEIVDPSRPHAKIAFTDVKVSLLGESGKGREIVTSLFNQAAVLFAFEQLGGAQAALKMAVDYSLDRFAFGRPIGSFQAIKHKLADLYTYVELARSNCYYGAWALNSCAVELPVAAASARLSATKVFHETSKESIQIHGGIGCTWEADCHLFLKRSRLLAASLGSSLHWKSYLVEQLLQSDAV